jgi:superfamily II DNA or RNA helicase
MRLDSVITMSTEEMTRAQWRKLFEQLTIVDNDGVELQAFDHRSGAGVVVMPRGALTLLPIDLNVSDLRSRPSMPKLKYAKTLDAPGYAGQSAAVEAMFEHEYGQVIAPPGRGKTEIALAFIAAAGTRTLVVVHTNDLLKQWVERAAVSVPGLKVGVIQGQTREVAHLTVATAQTLKQYLGAGGKFWRKFGAVIVDECHHSAAETWEWLLNSCPAFYRFGITASEKRSDGRQALVRFNIGPVIYRLKFESAVPMTVVPVVTNFRSRFNGTQWTKVVRDVVNNQERNALVASVIDREIEAGHTVLCLSRQIKHLDLIYEELADKDGVKIVTGQLTQRKRQEHIQGMRDGNIRCILGTQLFEEGVDIPRINRIILAFPGTEITALQKIGRGARKFVDKEDCIVYDLFDDKVAVLARQFIERKIWYRSAGITLGKAVKNGNQDQGEVSGRKRFSLSGLRVRRS